MNPVILAADTAVTPAVTSLLSDDLVKTFSDGLATIGSDVVKFIVVALPVYSCNLRTLQGNPARLQFLQHHCQLGAWGYLCKGDAPFCRPGKKVRETT